VDRPRTVKLRVERIRQFTGDGLGAVVAVRGELIWADLFASASLLGKYWPKLIRSYAAEGLTPRAWPVKDSMPSQASAQDFLDRLKARRQTVETEPGVYRLQKSMAMSSPHFS
jgi:hypothetical protein